MHFIPGMRLRATEEAEILGIDDAEMGEFAYDYVGIDLGNGHDFHDDTHSHGVLPSTTGGREPRHTPIAAAKHEASSEEGEVEKRAEPVAVA